MVVSYSISTSNHNYDTLVMTTACVVSYSISTSNHNQTSSYNGLLQLYLIPFLHQTTTLYIVSFVGFVLYLIPFLHQTTTLALCFCRALALYLIPFLHQTTTTDNEIMVANGCILFHFYIKPQPMAHKTLFSSTLSPKSHSHFQRNAVV